MEASVVLRSPESEEDSEERRLRQRIVRTRLDIERSASGRPITPLLAFGPHAVSGEGALRSAPANMHRAARLPPPCVHCGTRQYVTPFYETGAWICHGVDESAAPAAYCNHTWHEEVPILICPRRKCRGGGRVLESHFGQLGLACRACRRFEALADLNLPASAPPRIEATAAAMPTPTQPARRVPRLEL